MPVTSTLSKPKQNRIKQLASQGHSKTSIAKLTGISSNTIDKYLSVDATRQGHVKQFKDRIGDLLHETLLSGMSIQHRLLISLGNEDVESIQLPDKIKLMKELNVTNGTIFDKIRLHEGKSTTNSSHHLQVNLAHQHLFPSPTSSGSAGKEVDATKGNDCGIMSHSPDNHTQAIDNTEITER